MNYLAGYKTKINEFKALHKPISYFKDYHLLTKLEIYIYKLKAV